MIAMIDYGAGNLRSVANAFEVLGREPFVTSKPEDLDKASVIVLPGVGAFGDGMAALRRLGMVEALEEQVRVRKKPFLGICVGLQMLADEGFEHGVHKGLGWIPGVIRRIKTPSPQYRVPHMGWNELRIHRSSPLVDGIENPVFYFLHSYHFDVPDSHREAVVATCWHGEEITAVIQHENIMGVQFHPEKSQEAGRALLENFLTRVADAVNTNPA